MRDGDGDVLGGEEVADADSSGGGVVGVGGEEVAFVGVEVYQVESVRWEDGARGGGREGDFPV